LARTHISFRESIDGRVASFLMDARVTSCIHTRDGLTALIDSLAAYQEEGKKLYPKIIFSEDLQTVKMLLPQVEIIEVGDGSLSEATFRTCLKKCAPLATGEWYIFIERQTSKISYGLIRSGDGVITLAPENRIQELETDASAATIVILRQVTDRTVELVTSNNHFLTISFSGRSDHDTDHRPKLVQLFNQISEHCELELKDKLSILLDRVFTWVIERGHGALAVVVEGEDFRPSDGLKDGNWLRQPLDLVGKVRAVVQLHDPEAVTSARAIIEVVTGMLMSDGITVFDNHGHVLGFAVFAKPSTPEEAEVANSQIGGARRRAFALLSSWVGAGLIVGCFMVSQDGGTAYRGSEG